MATSPIMTKRQVSVGRYKNVLPCPCCGGRRITAVDYIYGYSQTFQVNEWIVECDDCGHCVDDSPTKAEAIASWNRLR